MPRPSFDFREDDANPSFAPPRVLCIRQKACAVTGIDDFAGQNFTGTVTSTQLTATTESPVHQDCTGEITNGALGNISCTAPAVGITCSGTTAAVALKNATDTCCSVNAQDCATGERCQPIGNATNFQIPACIPDRGTVDLNGACTRASTAVEDVGDDDCKKGLFCANFGQVNPTTRVCRKLCLTNADCGAGNECAAFATGAGVCVERCKLFDASDAGGVACGAGTTCRTTTSYGSDERLLDTRCDFIGAVALGGACTFTEECGVGATCVNQACSALCDATHPCAAGACTKFSDAYVPEIEPSTGFCQ